jgi:hypothetical protein
VDLSQVTPVEIRSPTLVADADPYNSLKPKLKPLPAPQPPAAETADNPKTESTNGDSEVKTASNAAAQNRSDAQPPESTSEIRKAIPVEPIRKAIPVQPQERKPAEIRRAIPVRPMDAQGQEQPLLRSAESPPRDIDE